MPIISDIWFLTDRKRRKHRSEIFAGLGAVDHERKLVAFLAFFDSCAKVKVVMAVVYVKRGLYVIFVELDGVRAVAVERVLEVAAAFDFPAVVDVAACSERKRDCT